MPSLGPVDDSAVQPCHGRKIEHALLVEMRWVRVEKEHYIRNIVEITLDVNSWRGIKGVVILPMRSTFEDIAENFSETRIFPSFNRTTIDMGSESELSVSWLTNS